MVEEAAVGDVLGTTNWLARILTLSIGQYAHRVCAHPGHCSMKVDIEECPPHWQQPQNHCQTYSVNAFVNFALGSLG
jgi:hypothetical protein